MVRHFVAGLGFRSLLAMDRGIVSFPHYDLALVSFLGHVSVGYPVEHASM